MREKDRQASLTLLLRLIKEVLRQLRTEMVTERLDCLVSTQRPNHYGSEGSLSFILVQGSFGCKKFIAVSCHLSFTLSCSLSLALSLLFLSYSHPQCLGTTLPWLPSPTTLCGLGTFLILTTFIKIGGIIHRFPREIPWDVRFPFPLALQFRLPSLTFRLAPLEHHCNFPRFP